MGEPLVFLSPLGMSQLCPWNRWWPTDSRQSLCFKISDKHRAREPRNLTPRVGSTSVPTSGPTKTPTRAPTRVPTRVPTNVHFPVLALQGLPTKVPTKRPTRVSTEVPTKVSTKAVSFHMSCFHMFCSLPKIVDVPSSLLLLLLVSRGKKIPGASGNERATEK